MTSLDNEKQMLEAELKNIINTHAGILTEKYKLSWFKVSKTIVDTEKLRADNLYEKYSNVSVSYGYTIKSASSNLLYMCPIDYKSVEIFAGGNKLNPQDFSPFAFYVSLYGFGLGRLEVSKHLNNESLVHGGTYWAKE